ncbi:MAG: hypothetical protein SWY16_20190 [Cyanobacteriota bacterium]|nr:hypothetical protein [Cyanobacteriota bacterium]
MLILTPDRVRYCIVTRTLNGQEQKLTGLIYHAQLFVLCKSYTKDRKKEAVWWYRRNFLERSDPLSSFILEEPNCWSIWHQDDRVTYVMSCDVNRVLLSCLDCRKLTAQMRKKPGLHLRDRRCNFRLYSQCFSGRDAVSWMMKYLNLSRDEAIELGQQLMEKKWIYHITHEHPFLDECLLYQFYE